MNAEKNTWPAVGLFVVVLSLTAFVLNWAWEMVQMQAYVEMAGRTWSKTAWRCAVAAVGDLGAALAIYAIGSLSAGTARWGHRIAWTTFAAAAVMGAATGVAIELRALAAGKWSYNSRMPVLPLIRVGLWPFLQLTILVPLSLMIAAHVTHIVRRRS